MDTLPDFLRPGLDLVSVGLNPSPVSVRAGFYFASPRNRFWKALNASRLAGRALEPGIEAHRLLLEQGRIGFTDVVKRPTPGAGDLRAGDFREWAPRLRGKLEHCRPALAWFHGRVALTQYLRYGEGREVPQGWGLLGELACGIPFYVTPNPSPANARFGLAELVRYYDGLAAQLEQALA